ncbi:MAG: hypothetical protein ACPGVU_25630 [Limisphaerales bacterium]
MHLSEFEQLLEIRACRPLNAGEQDKLHAWLHEHQEDRELWEEEEALSSVLDDLPESPVSSNFTSRVWQQIELDSRAPEPRAEFNIVRFLSGSWLRIPRMAWVCALILALGISAGQRRVHQQEQLAESMVPVLELAQVPSVEVLQDFDAINTLSEPMVSGDLELLLALEEK